jgi:hypothetical protein
MCHMRRRRIHGQPEGTSHSPFVRTGLYEEEDTCVI